MYKYMTFLAKEFSLSCTCLRLAQGFVAGEKKVFQLSPRPLRFGTCKDFLFFSAIQPEKGF